MRTFTKFLTLFFLLAIIGSNNLNAQFFADPNGDGGSPFLEIWIYGATLDGVALPDGTEIAAFDGDKIVGVMTIDIPSPGTQVDETNWVNNKLIAYSKDASGNDLYQPGNPIILKASNGTSLLGSAYTWSEEPPANTGHIDFHNTWYAPIGDTTGFTNIGAYYPEEGGYGYCYVDLGFVSGDVTGNHTIAFTVTSADGLTENAEISSAGYSGTTDVNGELDLPVLWVSGSAEYIFTITHASYDTEKVTVTVSDNVGQDVSIFMDSYGSVSGNVEYTNVNGVTAPASGATVSLTVFDSTYTTASDAAGDYIITNIPDGDYTLTASYTGCDNGTLDVTIVGPSSTLADQDFSLVPVQGTVEGEFFNATNLNLITAAPTSFTLNGVELFGDPRLNIGGDGSYNLIYNAGTYDLVINFDNYVTYTLEDFVINPSVTATENFNLLPDTYSNYYDEITGNPNMMWSIHIESAKFGASSLLPYDQIAIFNVEAGAVGSGSEVHVGTLTLDKSAIWQNSGYNVLKAYGQLNTGATGFIEGNAIDFRGYDVSHGNGYPTGEPLSWSFNSGLGTYSGTTFPDPAENEVSYLTINWDYPEGSIIGTVTDGVDAIENATVEVINIFTDETVGTTTTDITGAFAVGVDQGTYNVKFSKEAFTTVTETEIVVNQGDTYNMGEIQLVTKVKRTVTYWLGTSNVAGYYFIGRCIEQSDEDMLNILDNPVGSFTAFSGGYYTSWVENEDGERLAYNSVASEWQPVDYAWEMTEGYQVFRPAWYRFTMEGYVTEPEDNPIELDAAGIHYVPYYPYDYDNPDDAITAFASILESIDWVMDEKGNRLHKDNGNWIDNIGTLDPTRGYKIKATEAVTLTYPASASKANRNQRVMLEPVNYVYNGGNAADWTYTMYINTDDFEIGDEIAAFSDDVLVGSMVIDSDNAWENDLNTFFTAIDGGYALGADIELMAWDASENIDYNIEFEMIPEVNDAYIGTQYPAGLDHFSYVNVYRGTVRVDENQVNNEIRIYPNPTTGNLNINSVNEINSVNIYSIYGALIDIVELNSKTGAINIENYSAGTYLIQLNTDTGIITKRIILK